MAKPTSRGHESLLTKPWQEICVLDAIPEQAGIGACPGDVQVALSRFGQTIYALGSLEPGSAAQVLSRGILGDVQDRPIVTSPLYRQRIRLRDGRQYDNGEQVARAWLMKVEVGRVWVGAQALILRAEVS